MGKSNYHLLKEKPKDKIDEFIKSLSEEEAEYLLNSPDFILRPEQKIPKELLDGKKRNWLIVSGRGWGKNFSASKNLEILIKDYGYRNIIYVGRTKEDVRDVIIDGPSGIKKQLGHMNFKYEGHMNRIVFPDYDAVIRLRSGETPDSLRGPNTDLVIFDELASYQYPQETWENGQFGLRLNSKKGYPPIAIITTTPRPIDLIRELIKDTNTFITEGSTFDNPDLSPAFIKYLRDKYENTHIGKQELYGKIVDNLAGALWKVENILHISDKDKAKILLDPKQFDRIVIGVDPAVSANKNSDSTGIVVCGKRGDDLFVLDDKTGIYTPSEWARIIDATYNSWEADRIVVEVNQGGDLVSSNMRQINKNLSIKSVRAYRGKALRAEPIASLYEQGKVKHIKAFSELEDEMLNWVPGVTKKSPDRIDALVYALSELSTNNRKAPAGMVPATRINKKENKLWT